MNKSIEHYRCKWSWHLDFKCQTVKRVYIYDTGPAWPLTAGRQIRIVVPGDYDAIMSFNVFHVVVSLLDGIGFIYDGSEYDVNFDEVKNDIIE